MCIRDRVGQLLELSQLESGALERQDSIFSINELCNTIIDTQQIFWQQKGLKVERDYACELVVQGDYHKIGQVMTNLFENAVKYCTEGGVVQVSTELKGEKCRISVYNQGECIPEEEKENLFVSFYRADKARSRQSKSYGLSLIHISRRRSR